MNRETRLKTVVRAEPRRVKLSEHLAQRRQHCIDLMQHFERELKLALRGEGCDESLMTAGQLALPKKIVKFDRVKDASEMHTDYCVVQVKGSPLTFGRLAWLLRHGQIKPSLKASFADVITSLREDEVKILGPRSMKYKMMPCRFDGPPGAHGLDEHGLAVFARLVARLFKREKIAYGKVHK